ncbi:energy transducer TonB [Methylomonas sp. TEB]
MTLQCSSNHDGLDESPVDVVNQWRFVPAKLGDTPEAC